MPLAKTMAANDKPDTTNYYPVDKPAMELGTLQTPATPAKIVQETPEPLRKPGKAKTQWILDDGFVKATINSRAGYIQGVSLTEEQKQILPEVTEFYSLETDPETHHKGLEKEDIILSVKQCSLTELTLLCRNNALPGITFRKDYALDKGVLTKTVTIGSTHKNARLVRIGLTCHPLQLTYSENGPYGFCLPPGYFPEDTRALFWLDRWPAANTVFMPAIVYPKQGITTGIHIHRINGRYIFARENDTWNRPAPTTLQMNLLAGGFVGSSRELSYEYQIRTVKGDAIAWHRSYKQLSGYQGLFSDQKDPAWTDRVLMVTDCGPMDMLPHTPVEDPLPPPLLPPQKNRDLILDDRQDVYLLWTLFGWNGPSAMPTEGAWFNENPLKPFPMTPERVHWCLNRWRQGDPRHKVGLYDWTRSYDPKLTPFCNHPEWAALDINGNPMRSFFKSSIFPPDRKPNYLEPGLREHLLTQRSRIVSTYGVDSYYIDAEASDRYPDWRTKTWFQPYDRYDFMKAGRHASGRELPLLKNTPNTPYATYYLWEGRGLYANGMDTRWQAVGEKMLCDKIYQWNHRWTALLITHGSDQEPYYSNYIVGLGYKPHARSFDDYPYMEAGFEMRHLRLSGAEFHPCYWRNDPTDIEAYLTQQGNAIYLSCISHEKDSRSVAFQIEPGKLPFKDNTPLFAWEIQLDDPHTMAPALKDEYEQRKGSKELAEPDFLAKLKGRPVAKNRFVNVQTFHASNPLEVSASARPTLLTMLALSSVPAIVLADGEERTQMQVPCTADVSTGGRYDPDSQVANIFVQSRHSCRIGILKLKERKIVSLRINGIKADNTTIRIEQDEYQSIQLPAGTSAVDVHYTKE